jgi:hypothetical protein
VNEFWFPIKWIESMTLTTWFAQRKEAMLYE